MLPKNHPFVKHDETNIFIFFSVFRLLASLIFKALPVSRFSAFCVLRFAFCRLIDNPNLGCYDSKIYFTAFYGS